MAVTDLTGTKWQLNSTMPKYSTTKAHFALDFTISSGEYAYSSSSQYNCIGLMNYWYLFFAPCNSSGGRSRAIFYQDSWKCEISGGSVAIEPPILEIFGGANATNTALISYLETNATQIIEATPTTITCNGTDTELNEGQTATLKCANKKAVSDIVVAFGVAGTITYNGTETAIESGKTATLECDGKKMATDVVIAL